MIASNDAGQLSAWLQLQQTEGVGNDSARRLLAAIGLPTAILSSSFERLCEVVPERLARALVTPPSAPMRNKLEQALEWAAQPTHRILTLADQDYPPALLNITDPPLLLYAHGRIELLAAPMLAVVGSRNATQQGTLNAERFAEAVSHQGITVISGLALGIDAAAHQGGLRGRGASVAVIGTGIDIVYPARNRELTQRLAQEGCIVSEYALGIPPAAANFPRRNRLISGLSRAVLVVEAAARSGSLITARMAAEQGREVLAIPGSIHAPLSKGCHLLIKQGARLAESVEDILEELGPLPSASPVPSVAVTDDSVVPIDGLLPIIGYDPVDADTLSVRSGLAVETLHAQLLLLELACLVECLPGGYYRRIN
jgi:DNA processing protein